MLYKSLKILVWNIMVKVQKLYTGQLVVTIPKRLAEYEHISQGMDVDFKKHKDGFIMTITGGKHGK